MKKTEGKSELTHTGDQFYRKSIVYKLLLFYIKCSYANTDSGNKGGSGFQRGQLVPFSLFLLLRTD